MEVFGSDFTHHGELRAPIYIYSTSRRYVVVAVAAALTQCGVANKTLGVLDKL